MCKCWHSATNCTRAPQLNVLGLAMHHNHVDKLKCTIPGEHHGKAQAPCPECDLPRRHPNRTTTCVSTLDTYSPKPSLTQFPLTENSAQCKSKQPERGHAGIQSYTTASAHFITCLWPACLQKTGVGWRDCSAGRTEALRSTASTTGYPPIPPTPPNHKSEPRASQD